MAKLNPTTNRAVAGADAAAATDAKLAVGFTYFSGLASPPASQAVLVGNWSRDGKRSAEWSEWPMTAERGSDGCRVFAAQVKFDLEEAGQAFRWGVRFLSDSGEPGLWAIATEENRVDSSERVRGFVLRAPVPSGPPQEEAYHLNQSRRLGAQKYYRDPSNPNDRPGIRFSLWAPNARNVEVCMASLCRAGDPRQNSVIDASGRSGAGGRAVVSQPRGTMVGGYVANDGTGIQVGWGPFRMTRGTDGIWTTDVNDPALGDFTLFDHAPYMFRVTKDDGTVAYRTDLYSRCQIGYGVTVPGGPFFGPTTDLDGVVGCSVVVDPCLVTRQFEEPVWPETEWDKQKDFFDVVGAAGPGYRDPQDLVIYELHVGALGADAVARGERDPGMPGTIGDAMDLVQKHLVDLGVNAVELLPLSQFGGGGANWGYSTSHYFAIEYGGGGRDNYKHFVRACHQKDMTVLLDVVYNHYNHSAERAEWMYDTDTHSSNCYYWYEGLPGDYSDYERAAADWKPGDREPRPVAGHGGYLDNVSTGYAPRFWEEQVRSMFVSSAVTLAAEFGVDGFRVDQTTSIHDYNVLHANGARMDGANAFGSKLLRELTRAVRLAKPGTVLFAEDHSNRSMVTESPDAGGLGFDATWYADFYHHLVGDTDKGDDYAKLIKGAGFGDDRPLRMDYFAGAMAATGSRKIVYHESHDEAGNGTNTHRTIVVAVNGAPLFGQTRRVAEARCRFAAAMTLLSAGIPMFLFGEEVGAERDFKYNEVLANREDLFALRQGSGRFLFRYYQDLIRLRLAHPGLRSRNIDVFFTHNENRLIGFRRWSDGEEFLVFASLNNRPFDAPGYTFNAMGIPAGRWREAFNTDASDYGGNNVGNGGQTVDSPGGSFSCAVPANGAVVFRRV